MVTVVQCAAQTHKQRNMKMANEKWKGKKTKPKNWCESEQKKKSTCVCVCFCLSFACDKFKWGGVNTENVWQWNYGWWHWC